MTVEAIQIHLNSEFNPKVQSTNTKCISHLAKVGEALVIHTTCLIVSFS